MGSTAGMSWWRSFEARLLLGAFLLRILYLSSILPSPFFTIPITDEEMYDRWARSIVAGEQFLGHYPYYDSPLHAFYLAALYWVFGPSLLAVRLVQVVIGTINVALLYRIARRLFDDQTAKVAGLFAATYLPFLYFEGLLLKESFALFLLNASLLLMLGAAARPTGLAWWTVGVVIGLLSLSRVNALALIPALLIVMWIRGPRQAGAVLALFLGLVMAIAPVTIRNRLVSGEWVSITVSGGQVLYTANQPANRTGDLMAVPFVRATSLFERVDFHRRAEADTGRRMTPTEVSAYWQGQSLRFALEHPGTQARMIGHRFLRFWNSTELPDNHSLEIFKRFSWILRLPLPGYWLIAPFALAGLALLWPRRRELSLLYLVLGFYVISLLPFWVSSRYRLPIVGVLILLAAAAMVELRRRVLAGRRAGHPHAWLKPAVGLLAACLFCWWPMGQPPTGDLERNLAYAYEQNGQFDEAVAIYQRLRIQEQNPQNDLFLANALGQAGRTQDALDILTRLTKPDQPAPVRRQAYNFIGDLARLAKRWEAAERAYRQALALDRTDYGAWNNLAVTLIFQQRFNEAEDALQRSIRLAPEDSAAQRNLDGLRRYRAQPPSPGPPPLEPLQGVPVDRPRPSSGQIRQ